jgi:hypothetical protein
MISLFPVVVTNTSMSLTTFSILTTYKPFMQACKAQIGSTSVTYTRAPHPTIAAEHPLPTSPYPQINTFFPASMTSVALKIPIKNIIF